MSEIKHTPGPWRVGGWSGRCHKPSHQGMSHPGPRGNDPCVYTPEFVEGLHGIAAEGGVHVVSVSYDELAMTEADARLIAAAPELLEALLVVLSDLEIGAHPHLHLDQIRAAIAKATGSQS